VLAVLDGFFVLFIFVFVYCCVTASFSLSACVRDLEFIVIG
jgi:hypothetical protein